MPLRTANRRVVQGYLAHGKQPPPPLSIVLLYGSRGGRFLMGEVPHHDISIAVYSRNCSVPQTVSRYQEAIDKGYKKALSLEPDNLSDTPYLCMSSRKSTPPQNRQLDILISKNKQSVADFVTFYNSFIHTFCEIKMVSRYQEAIDKGYKKALSLEPDNAQFKKALDMAQVCKLNISAHRLQYTAIS